MATKKKTTTKKSGRPFTIVHNEMPIKAMPIKFTVKGRTRTYLEYDPTGTYDAIHLQVRNSSYNMCNNTSVDDLNVVIALLTQMRDHLATGVAAK